MPIVPTASDTYSTVQSIIDKVSQDIRLQLASTSDSPGQPVLIDYCDRISKQMLRFSRWSFLLSEPQYFITSKGQSDYWIGQTTQQPNGMVDTGLNLLDVDRMDKSSVRDLSNFRSIKALNTSPIGSSQTFRSGQSRPGLPGTFWHNHNDLSVLHIYPGADNNNTYQPSPEPPVLFSNTNGGTLPQRTYYVRTTLVDSLGGESVGSSVSVNLTIPTTQLITVGTPVLPFASNASGVLYNSYNVYIATAEGSETLQNASPISIGTNWTEPTTGLISSGASCPTASTIAEFEGYIIQFRYFKTRLTLTDVNQSIQIPSDYDDVVVHGINALAWKLIGDAENAQESQQFYKNGLTEMVMDKNQFPDTDFVRPDPASYVNGQGMGIWPDTW